MALNFVISVEYCPRGIIMNLRTSIKQKKKNQQIWNLERVRQRKFCKRSSQTLPIHENSFLIMWERFNIWNTLLTWLTLTLPGPSAGVSGSLDSYCSLKPLCSGMGEVVPARTSPTLLPPSPGTVLSLSCFKVLQCINCRDFHCKS